MSLIVGLVALFGPGSEAGAQAVALGTQPSLFPPFDSSIPDYVVRCTSGTPVQVTVATDPATAVDVDGQGARGGIFTTSVDLGMGQEFGIVVTSGTNSSTYHVRCLPSDFPHWTFQRSSAPEAEWYVVRPFSRTDFASLPPGVSGNYGAIFDTNGVPVWWLKTGARSLDFKVLPDGNIGWQNDYAGREIRLDGSIAHTVLPVAAIADPHEFLLLPNGDYLIAADRSVTGQTACGHSGVSIIDDGVEEIAPDGSLVWSWWPSDHIPLSEIPDAWCPSIVGSDAGSYDAYHINSIEPDGDGYLVSFRHLDAVYRIRKSDGGIDWKLGGVTTPESLTVVNDPVFAAGDGFRGQHDARVLPDGTVSIHDNGYHPDATNRPPRAVRYAIDTATRTATLVQEVDDPGTVASPSCCGSARMLPGGDWVMNWGSAGLVTELSSTGSRVMSLTFDDGTNGTMFSYRAQPILPGTLSRDALRDGMNAQFPRGYARPKGASPVRVPLVPAYVECTSPNSTHGPPLAYGSCNPPTGASSNLTVGTPDANGAGANLFGSVTFSVRPSDSSTTTNEADVGMNVSLSDVRQKSDLSDYTGELQLRVAVRITDRMNGSTGTPATVQDTDFPATVPCTPTDSATVGATCAVSTSFNAIVPGAVVEHQRAIWQLGQVQVYDGGADGVASTNGDNTLFATEGVFVP